MRDRVALSEASLVHLLGCRTTFGGAVGPGVTFVGLVLPVGVPAGVRLGQPVAWAADVVLDMRRKSELLGQVLT